MYNKLEDAQKAYEGLTKGDNPLKVNYVPRNNNSDEVYNFN